MTRNLRWLPALVLLLAGCAGKVTYVNAKGSLKLERRQIVEIQEAFKDIEEKVITVDKVGEVSCSDKRCYVPIVGSAERVREGKAKETAQLKGILVFTREATTRLIELVELGHKKGNEVGEKGAWGEVLCDSKKCTLTFSMDNDTQVPVSTLMTPREVAADDGASR